MKVTINVLTVNQGGNIFYIGKLRAKELAKIATTKVRRREPPTEKDNYFNEIDALLKEKKLQVSNESIYRVHKYNKDNTDNQREQSIARLKEIGEYIEKANSIVPNAIICNLASIKDDIDINELIEIDRLNGTMTFDSEQVELSIVDGQHRLGGFGYTNNQEYFLDNYELIVTILVGLKPAQQAELFATINGKQKPVNKSILYDLSGLSETEYSEQLSAHLITTWFNITEYSPLKGKIKMLGTGEGYISQAAMIDAIVPLFKPAKKSKNINEKIDWPVFYKYFLKKEMQPVIQYLYDYFYCLSDVFSDAWNMKDSEYGKSILLKTTGFSGLILAYPLVNVALMREENPYDKLYMLIKRAFDNGFCPYSSKYQGGGKALQKQFAEDFLGCIFDEEEKRTLINVCIHEYL